MRDNIFRFVLMFYMITREHMFLMSLIGFGFSLLDQHYISRPISLLVIGACVDQLLELHYMKKITKDSDNDEINLWIKKCYEKEMAYYIYKIPTTERFRKTHSQFLKELFYMTRQLKSVGKMK